MFFFSQKSNGRLLFAKYLCTTNAGSFSSTKQTANQQFIFKIKLSNQWFYAKTTHTKLRRVFSGNKSVSYVVSYVENITKSRAYVT